MNDKLMKKYLLPTHTHTHSLQTLMNVDDIIEKWHSWKKWILDGVC